VAEIGDIRVVKALAHPIRVAAVARLEDRTMSPKELADELDVQLPVMSYHVRQLERHGLIELVRTAQRRGAMQHYYRAKPRPKISDALWTQTPDVIEREQLAASLRDAHSAVVTAAAEGGFDRADIHASRTSFVTDERGWKELSRLMARTLERAERIQAKTAARLARNHGADDKQAALGTKKASVTMMLFEGPYGPQPGRDGRSHSRSKARRKN
jgi:DNA-binding transcriptional ArsR family regulator